MKVLMTGSSGLVGTRIKDLLDYEFEDINRRHGVDIADKNSLFKKVASSNARILLHLAAKTDVDTCEKDREIDEKFLQQNNPDRDLWLKSQTAWGINVLGTKNVVDACRKYNKKLIYISTDFVFDGTKEDGYTEEDKENPLNWYGKTKFEAEKTVRESGINWAIARIAYPYRAEFVEKKDFVRTILERLQAGKAVYMITDHIMTPTFVDDFVLAVDTLIKNNSEGTFHTVGESFISPYDAANLIAERFDLNKGLIFKTTRDIYFKGKAERPFFLGLKNDKITKLGQKMRAFEEGLDVIQKQLRDK